MTIGRGRKLAVPPLFAAPSRATALRGAAHPRAVTCAHGKAYAEAPCAPFGPLLREVFARRLRRPFHQPGPLCTAKRRVTCSLHRISWLSVYPLARGLSSVRRHRLTAFCRSRHTYLLPRQSGGRNAAQQKQERQSQRRGPLCPAFCMLLSAHPFASPSCRLSISRALARLSSVIWSPEMMRASSRTRPSLSSGNISV